MFEFLNLCVHPLNLAYSLLLLGVLAYWLLFVVGAAGLDWLDVDLDLELDGDIDVDVDVDLDGDGGHPLEAAAHGTGSFFWEALRFFHVGEVPLTVLLSVLVLSSWSLNMLGNYYFNAELHTGRGLLLMVPAFGIALLATKFTTLPLRALRHHTHGGAARKTRFVGRTCQVTTSEVTDRFGQAVLMESDGPVTINIRCAAGATIPRGTEVVITDHDLDTLTFHVVALNVENHQ